MELHGIGVSAGVAAGPVARVAEPVGVDAHEDPTSDVDSAYTHATAALSAVESSLRAAAGEAPNSAREVLTMTADLAADRGLARAIKKELGTGVGLTRAVHNAADVYAAKLTKIGGYFAERVSDLFDVRDRAIAELRGLPAPGIPTLCEPAIIVAADLAPADTATLDPHLVRGIITERGGPTSHTAILAAQLGIPAVVQVAGALDIDAGTRVVIDGGAGEVLVEPSDDDVARLEQRARQREELISEFSGPGRTSDGQRVQLLANIGTDQDALLLADADVDGVGLFRTEFLFLDRHDEPTVEEQTAAYTRAMRDFSGRKFVARTLDAGADKPLAFANQGEEDNPALGVRGPGTAVAGSPRRHARRAATSTRCSGGGHGR